MVVHSFGGRPQMQVALDVSGSESRNAQSIHCSVLHPWQGYTGESDLRQTGLVKPLRLNPYMSAMACVMGVLEVRI